MNLFYVYFNSLLFDYYFFWVGELLFVCEFGRLNATATVSTDEQINNEFNYEWNFMNFSFVVVVF